MQFNHHQENRNYLPVTVTKYKPFLQYIIIVYTYPLVLHYIMNFSISSLFRAKFIDRKLVIQNELRSMENSVYFGDLRRKKKYVNGKVTSKFLFLLRKRTM